MRPRTIALLAAGGLATAACARMTDADAKLRAGERYALVTVDARSLPVTLPLLEWGGRQLDARLLADTIAVDANGRLRRVRSMRVVFLEALPCNALEGMAATGSGGISGTVPEMPAVRDSSCDALRTSTDTATGQLAESSGVQAISLVGRDGSSRRGALTWHADTLRVVVEGDSTVYAYRRVARGSA